MPDSHDVIYNKEILCKDTDQHLVVLPPKGFSKISETPFHALTTNVSSCQNNSSNIFNTLNYKYPESKLRMSHEAQEFIPQSSNRLVLSLSKTSTSSLDISGRIVIPPQKDQRTAMLVPSRTVLLGEKNSVIGSSLTNRKTQMMQHNSIKQDQHLSVSSSYHKSSQYKTLDASTISKFSNQRKSSDTSSISKSSNQSKSSDESLTNKSSNKGILSVAYSKSSEKYLDYLEEMELKIRYMKNDIEFKQDQILARNNVKKNSVQPTVVVKRQPYGKTLEGKLSNQLTMEKTIVPKVQQSFPSLLVSGASGVNLTASSFKTYSDEVKNLSINVAQSQSRQVLLPSRTQANAVSANQPIVYVSPDKRKVIFSDENRTKSAPSVKKALFQGQGTSESERHSDSVVSHGGPQTQLNQNSFKNRYKLVKNAQETATKTLSHLKRMPPSNVQNSAKLVSKYKLKRLSPTSALKLAPSFYKSIRIESISSTNSMTPISLAKKLSLASVKKTPTLKLQSAAKLVSKYRLKRLSPTSVLKRAPAFYRGVAHERHRLASVASNPLGTYSRNRLKLDKRIVEKIMPQRSGSLMKLDRRTNDSSKAKLQLNQLGKASTHDTNTFSYFNAAASQFKWSRPNLQANNTWRLKMRQKFRPCYTGAHRYASFKMDKIKRLSKNLIKIGDHLYKSNSTQLTRIRRHSSSSSAPDRTGRHHFKRATTHRGWGMQKTKLISLQGIHFNIDSQGKKLTRTVYASSEKGIKSGSSLSSESGVKSMLSDLKRSDENARLAASRAVYRSIAIATAKYKKSNQRMKSQKQHCIFFGRFGKCFRGDSCPYTHDPQKVAVCTRFLRGRCDAVNCPFSHKASVNKMPVCLYYLRGSCSRDGCPYLHVKVNPDAPTCRDFLNGFCPLGDKCKKLHSLVCPTFSHTGTCHRGAKCPMLHRQRKRDQPTGPRPITSSVSTKRISKLSMDKPFMTRSTNSGLILVQPSFISLTTQDSRQTSPAPSAEERPVQEQMKPAPSRLSFISLLSTERALPGQNSTRITPAFLSLTETSLKPETAMADDLWSLGDSLKNNDSKEPVTSLKITPSFLSLP